MNERNQMSPEAQEPESGVPQDLVDELMALAQEVRATEAKAARGWKLSLAGWVILLAVIFSYLYFWVYRTVVVPIFEPTTLVQMGMGVANGILEKQGLPELASAQFAPQLADRLKSGVPTLVQERLKPQLMALQEQLPDRRIELTQKFKANAPEIMDHALDYFQQNLLPNLHKAMLTLVSDRADELLDRADETIGDAVTQVIASHWEDMEAVGPEQMPKLQKALADAFEEQMGEVLDEMFEGTDERVANVRMQIEDLVDRQKSKSLTEDDMLEIRLVQLCLALFTAMKEAPPEVEESAIEQLMGQLRSLGIGAAAREEIGREYRAGVTPDFSHLPPDQREAAQKAFEESERERAAAEAKGARAVGPGRAPYGHQPPTGPVQQPQIPSPEEAQRRAAAGRAQAGAPVGPPPTKEELEAEAKRMAEEAKARAEAAHQ